MGNEKTTSAATGQSNKGIITSKLVRSKDNKTGKLFYKCIKVGDVINGSILLKFFDNGKVVAKCGHCGSEFETRLFDLHTGKTKSCGCLLLHGANPLTQELLDKIISEYSQGQLSVKNLAKKYNVGRINLENKFKLMKVPNPRSNPKEKVFRTVNTKTGEIEFIAIKVGEVVNNITLLEILPDKRGVYLRTVAKCGFCNKILRPRLYSLARGEITCSRCKKPQKQVEKGKEE